MTRRMAKYPQKCPEVCPSKIRTFPPLIFSLISPNYHQSDIFPLSTTNHELPWGQGTWSWPTLYCKLLHMQCRRWHNTEDSAIRPLLYTWAYKLLWLAKVAVRDRREIKNDVQLFFPTSRNTLKKTSGQYCHDIDVHDKCMYIFWPQKSILFSSLF